MILGVGIDIVDIPRVKRSLEKWGSRWEKKIFTGPEMDYCRRFNDPAPHYAARFAAKEAVFKALPRQPRAFFPREIEIVLSDSGRPAVKTSGETADSLGDTNQLNIHLSLSHEKATAAAIVVIEGK